MRKLSWIDKSSSPGVVRFALIMIFALGIPAPHPASTSSSCALNRITSISPSCANPGEPVTIKGFGFGARNIIVTVAGLEARVTHANGHPATFIVPASAPYGPTTVAMRHRKGSQIGSIAFQVGCGQTNRTPVAQAGPDRDVTVGEWVTLDGRNSSDPDGNLSTYLWTLVSAPVGSIAALDNPTSVAPTFRPDLPGAYSIVLVVNDGQLDSAPDTVLVTVLNGSPVANAGPDRVVVAGALVTLDGSGSADRNGDALTYSWTLVSSPAGSTTALNLPTSVPPTITPVLPGTYTISLTVSHGQATSSPDAVAIQASVPSVLVPDVVGMVQANAEAAIVAVGLAVGGISTANSDAVAAGNVISQSPLPARRSPWAPP
jgi:hypothetical protein